MCKAIYVYISYLFLNLTCYKIKYMNIKRNLLRIIIALKSYQTYFWVRLDFYYELKKLY